MRPLLNKLHLTLIILTFPLLSNNAAATQKKVIQLRGKTMGTSYNIKAITDSAEVTKEKLQAKIDLKLAEVNQMMSTFQKDSELSKFNQQQSINWFPTSKETATVANKAKSIGSLTHGSFDVTIGKLIDLWGFGPSYKKGTIPKKDDIKNLIAISGNKMFEVRLNPPAIKKKDATIELNFSGIAKGYGVDVVSSLLEQQKINRYMVEIGGEVRTKGTNPYDIPWRIGIELPTPDKRSIYKAVNISNYAIATSGDYRNFIEKDGKRLSHILNPKTGYPVSHQTVSVSVITPSCTEADGLATALMVLGDEKGIKLAERKGLAVLFITQNKDGKFTEKYSSKFKNFMQK